MESVTAQDMVEAEYQKRFEVMYWLAALRMVPRPLSLDCVTDADTHGLDKPWGTPSCIFKRRVWGGAVECASIQLKGKIEMYMSAKF